MSQDNPELADLILQCGGYDALEVLRRTKRLLEARESEKQKAVLAAITEALRDELEDLSPTELVQRAKEFGVDADSIAAAMDADMSVSKQSVGRPRDKGHRDGCLDLRRQSVGLDGGRAALRRHTCQQKSSHPGASSTLTLQRWLMHWLV